MPVGAPGAALCPGCVGPWSPEVLAMEPQSPEVAASLERERKLRASAESEAAEQEQIEQALETQLADVQAAVSGMRVYTELIAEMGDADVRDACVEAGIHVDAYGGSQMRQLLLEHLCDTDPCDAPEVCNQEHAVRFVAADDDDDADDDTSEGTDSSDTWPDGGHEQAALQQQLSDAMDFRYDIVCLTPPDSEGEAEEHVEALDEIDAEIVALQKRLQSYRSHVGGRSDTQNVRQTSTSSSLQAPVHRHVELSSTDSTPKEVEEGSSAQALLAAAGLELSPGGTSYRIIGRQPRVSSPHHEPVRQLHHAQPVRSAHF